MTDDHVYRLVEPEQDYRNDARRGSLIVVVLGKDRGELVREVMWEAWWLSYPLCLSRWAGVKLRFTTHNIGLGVITENGNRPRLFRGRPALRSHVIAGRDPGGSRWTPRMTRSEEHTSELQSQR